MSTVLNQTAPDASWLKSYYFMRVAFSVLWIAAAVIVGRNAPAAAAVLLVIYPAWDALANLADARHNGGLGRSPSQAVNATVSALAAIAVALLVGSNLHAVLGIFGGWAVLAGILQLVTGVRRWSTGAQWAMVLSGAQSGLVGGYFIKQATGEIPVGIMDVVPYAGFGAFYFLVSAVWLTVRRSRMATA